jgi:serine phosphatase RsbU (regulator of sigma subunit)
MPPNQATKYPDDDRKWESLLTISEEAHTARSVEDFVAIIHHILSGLVEAGNFFIALYDESSEKYFFPYFVDECDKIDTVAVNAGYDEALHTNLYDLSGTLTDHVRTTGLPLRFPNEEMNTLYASGEIGLFGSESNAWLGIPLKHSGHTIGVMVVQVYDRAYTYSVRDEELLVFVSDHVARAIENVRAEVRMRRQHQLLVRQQEAITDSISYAKRIQKAVIPSRAYMENILSDFFTIHLPKDIVSGDFYWVREIEGHRVVVVADCTGHGVPGALMSMLGVALLNEQFRTHGIRKPGEILGNLRIKIKEILAQNGTSDGQRDGMDLAMVIIDPECRTLNFAGANRPLFLVREEELITIKGDKQPIGVHWEEREFTDRMLELREGDQIYLFTDGFVDQFGGEARKKFKTRKFRNLLLSLRNEPMSIQKKVIEEAFLNWRGRHEQIDDVCVMGLRI